MLTEVGSVASGGSQARWVADAMSAFRLHYPAVKAVVWFDVPYTETADFRFGGAALHQLALTLTEPYWRPRLRMVAVRTSQAVHGR
jgi:hypothetical protein